MTLGDLRRELAQISVQHDDKDLVVWLPGSKIDFQDKLLFLASSNRNEILVEGNVRKGSALSVEG